jgi:hypothetical protein
MVALGVVVLGLVVLGLVQVPGSIPDVSRMHRDLMVSQAACSNHVGVTACNHRQ